jgi:hypothetical protein
MDASCLPTDLLRAMSGPCLSLYLQLSGDRHADQIRVKSLVAQAKKLLEEWNPPLGEEHAYAIMQPLWRLLGSEGFWRDHRHSRAVFLAPGYFTELFLPHAVEETVYIASDFLIRPLLNSPAAQSFLTLALHEDRVRLYEGGADGLHDPRRPLPDFATAVTHDYAAETGGDTAIPHDHSRPRGSGDANHARIKAYYQLIAALLHADHPKARHLVLVGTARNIALFCAAAHVLGDIHLHKVMSDPDSMPKEVFEHRAIEATQPYFSGDSAESLQRLRERTTGAPTEREPAGIIEAARKGQIETLWMERGVKIWGTQGGGAPAMRVISTGSDEDLLNSAAIEVLRHRGRVFEVEPGELEPGVKAMAALRYLADRYQTETPTGDSHEQP